jgi:hypothetical protein
LMVPLGSQLCASPKGISKHASLLKRLCSRYKSYKTHLLTR